MELKDFFTIIFRRIVIVFILTLVALAYSSYTSIGDPVRYQSLATLTVQANKEITTDYQYSGYYAIQASEYFANTVIGWAKSADFRASLENTTKEQLNRQNFNSLEVQIYARRLPPNNIALAISTTDKNQSEIIIQQTIEDIRERILEVTQDPQSSVGFELFSSQPTTIPITPRPIVNIIISIIIAIILSVILIFAIDYYQQKISTLSKAKDIFGVLPTRMKIGKKTTLYPQDSKEAKTLRLIRQSICPFSSNDKSPIAIIGENNKEENQKLASNLAISFSRAGKKTLLIDSYFTKPHIHEYFDKKNDYGLSELLFDKNDISKYIQKTNEDGLYIVSAGMKLAHASDSIERSEIRDIINEMKNGFDNIIISMPDPSTSPEILPLLASTTKSIILLQLGSAKEKESRNTSQLLDQYGIEKTVIVI